MNQCTNVRERELEKVDQTQTTRYVSRFEHTALRHRLHTEGFSLTCPHREPPLRIWANTTGSTQLLSKPIQPLTEAGHNQHKNHLTQEG